VLGAVAFVMPVALPLNQGVSPVFSFIVCYSELTFPPATCQRRTWGDGLLNGAHGPVCYFSFYKPELPFTSPEEVITFGLVCLVVPPTHAIAQKRCSIAIALNVAHMFCWGATEHFTITVHNT